MLKIGDNVYIVLENKLKFDALNVMEHWYAQDDIIIRCPILNTMTMDDGTVLYNIRFNNEVFQLLDYNNIGERSENELRCWNSTEEGCTVLKYGKLQCNPNGDYQEVLGSTIYFAFYKYEYAVKRFRWLFRLKLSQIVNNLNRLIKNMDMTIDYLDNDISVDADEYDKAVNKSNSDNCVTDNGE
jgi:hypothetical protein